MILTCNTPSWNWMLRFSVSRKIESFSTFCNFFFQVAQQKIRVTWLLQVVSPHSSKSTNHRPEGWSQRSHFPTYIFFVFTVQVTWQLEHVTLYVQLATIFFARQVVRKIITCTSTFRAVSVLLRESLKSSQCIIIFLIVPIISKVVYKLTHRLENVYYQYVNYVKNTILKAVISTKPFAQFPNVLWPHIELVSIFVLQTYKKTWKRKS